MREVVSGFRYRIKVTIEGIDWGKEMQRLERNVDLHVKFYSDQCLVRGDRRICIAGSWKTDHELEEDRVV